jgi:hypothetical protein
VRRAALIVLGAVLLGPEPVAAQDPAPLGDVLDNLAALWARGDATAIADLSATGGVDFEMEGETVGTISGRKLSAALRRVFDDRVTVAVVSRMTSAVQGVEDRAFGELAWELRRGGATLPEHSTVFLALVHEPVGWRVTQIRILE